MKEQKKKIMALLEERLSAYGFKKRGYDFFTRIIDGNIIQNMSFHPASREKIMYISPSIGVVYKDVSKIEEQLRNLGPSNYPDYVGFMVGTSIWNLMPEDNFIEWRFPINEDVTVETNKMADAIIKYGFPYQEELSNRASLINGLEEDKYSGSREFILPILLYLDGNYKRALECIDEFTNRFSNFPTPEDYEKARRSAGDDGIFGIANNALEPYLEFAKNFRQMLKQEEHL